MEIEKILSKEENEILDDGHNSIVAFCNKLDKYDFGKIAPMTIAATPGSSHESVDGFFVDIKTEFKTMVADANALYKKLKTNLNKQNSTHEFITNSAINLAGKINGTEKNILLDACTEPDHKRELYDLSYEGHFYGAIPGHKKGNFFHKVFKNKLIFSAFNLVGKINEDALGNFTRYLSEFEKSKNIETLGWTLHFLQDLTAPHHATNKAIFFEFITDKEYYKKHSPKEDSHFPFEKYAQYYVQDKEDLMLAMAKPLVDELTSELQSKGSKKFAEEIHHRALQHSDISQKDRDEVINANISLAIAASAVILDQAGIS